MVGSIVCACGLKPVIKQLAGSTIHEKNKRTLFLRVNLPCAEECGFT
jgi:hypothetical protein